MNNFTLEDVTELIQGDFELIGEYADIVISDFKTPAEADENSLIFISGERPDKQEMLSTTAARLVICDKELEISELILKEKAFLIVEEAKVEFARVASTLIAASQKQGIDASAVIHPEAEIHESAYVGPGSYVGKATIGPETVLDGHCYVYDNVTIGKRVHIAAGVIIGAAGFGHVHDKNGVPFNFPHIGGVIIEDNVEIGANCCVDRGALGNTTVKKHAKFDNFVHIAHNVVVGERVFITAHTMVAGSVVIENDCYIAPQVAVNDQLTIGAGAFIGIGAVVTKNVPQKQLWAGVPAKMLRKL